MAGWHGGGQINDKDYQHSAKILICGYFIEIFCRTPGSSDELEINLKSNDHAPTALDWRKK